MRHVGPVDAVLLYVVVEAHSVTEVGNEDPTVGAINLHLPDQVAVGENEFGLHRCKRQRENKNSRLMMDNIIP